MKTLKGTSAIRAYYDNYYLGEHKGYLSSARTAQEVRFLIKFSGRNPDSVCDIGCGNGRHLKAFQQAGVAKGFGFDLSGELVRLAKQNLSGSKNFVVENMSFTDWQPEQGAYDITYSVFSSFGYCHDLTEAQKLVSKMVHATARGGIIGIDVDNVFRLVRFLSSNNKKNSGTDKLEFNAESMQLRALEKRGDNILESYTRYFVAPDFARMFAEAGINSNSLVFRGDFDEGEYSYNSDRLIVLVKKQDG